LIATLDAPGSGYKDVAASASSGAPPASSTATGDLFLTFGTTPASAFGAGTATSANTGPDAFSVQRPDGKFLIVHANNVATTSIYDPVGNTMADGPTLKA